MTNINEGWGAATCMNTPLTVFSTNGYLMEKDRKNAPLRFDCKIFSFFPFAVYWNKIPDEGLT